MQLSSTLFESVFKREVSAYDTNAFLEQVAKDYPYFVPAQFYLLQQTKEDAATYNEQVAKTSVLFNNPFWLNFQLQEATRMAALKAEAKETATNIREQATTEEPLTIIPVAESIIVNEEDALKAEILMEETAVEEPVIDNNTTPEAAAPVQEEVTPIETIEIQTLAKEELITEEPVMEIEDNTVKDNQTSINITDSIENAANEFKSPTENKELPDNALVFEPLHVTDYFASQGIKLSDEIQSADKLGKQLRSFTEWLKTMKKTHPGKMQPLSDKVDEKAESAVQNLAEKSNTEADVVTEAMAEVLLQQGKKDKAKEVYEKLSLLNPSKNTYFAAKIDNLNE